MPLALFPADKANVGYYEVIGTLRQNGVIESMTAISLGDSMGAHALLSCTRPLQARVSHRSAPCHRHGHV